MNNIIMDKEKYDLDSINTNIEYNTNELNLSIKGEVIVNDFNNNQDLILNITLEDNASLVYNRLNNDINNIKVNITVNNNNKITYNQSIINNIEGLYNIDIDIKGSNNNIDTNIYGVTDNLGKLKIEATGNITSNVSNISFLENVRILMLNEEENIIIPNLLVSKDDVIVNHNATISSLDKTYLFYLMSKGLSYESAKKLIVNGFIFNKIDKKD